MFLLGRRWLGRTQVDGQHQVQIEWNKNQRHVSIQEIETTRQRRQFPMLISR